MQGPIPGPAIVHEFAMQSGPALIRRPDAMARLGVLGVSHRVKGGPAALPAALTNSLSLSKFALPYLT